MLLGSTCDEIIIAAIVQKQDFTNATTSQERQFPPRFVKVGQEVILSSGSFKCAFISQLPDFTTFKSKSFQVVMVEQGVVVVEEECLRWRRSGCGGGGVVVVEQGVVVVKGG